MICLFLAVLEMVKLQAVGLTQKDAFGEIGLKRLKGFDAVFASETDHGGDRRRISLDRHGRQTSMERNSTLTQTAPEETAASAGRRTPQLKAILEAIVYVADEPLSAQQIAAALEQPIDVVKRLLDELVAEFAARSTA